MPATDDAEVGRMVGEVAVTYTVKELLARIEERQIRLDQTVATLATRPEVDELRRIVQRHEARWNRVLGAALAIAAVTGGAAGWISTVFAGAGT